jgi:hypothetical protein
LDPSRDDSGEDPDEDSYTNLEEFDANTDPRNLTSSPFLHERTEKGWPIIAEAFMSTGDILRSIDPDAIETPEALAQTYYEAGAKLAEVSHNLLDLRAAATLETINSMAAQFQMIGETLSTEEFALVAEAFSNLADDLDLLIDPKLDTQILLAFQDALEILHEQEAMAGGIENPLPWEEELQELLDFYDSHTIDELQGLAHALLEEVQDPQEKVRFGLDDPELVETLQNLSTTLTSTEFQEWHSIARRDLLGWLDQASRETFILKTVELGQGLYNVGNMMIVRFAIIAAFITSSEDECEEVCVNTNCKGLVGFGPGVLSPESQSDMLIITYAPRKTPGTGPLLRKGLEVLKKTVMKDKRVVVWVKVTWEHCEERSNWSHLWQTNYKAWVEKETDWQRVDPTNDAHLGYGVYGWLGRNYWEADETLIPAMNKAINDEVNSKCP